MLCQFCLINGDETPSGHVLRVTLMKIDTKADQDEKVRDVEYDVCEDCGNNIIESSLSMDGHNEPAETYA